MESASSLEENSSDDTRVTTPVSASNVDGQEDHVNCSGRVRNHNKIAWIMKRFPIIITFIVTICALINSVPPKVQTTKYPSPFFPVSSLVTDYYLGDIENAYLRMLDTEYVFIFYYAPWDGASQSGKWEFHLAARYYHEQVTFIAVNCWYPDGQCRKQYSKIKSYPILVLYQIGLPGIQYRGPLHLANLMEFLRNAINPIHRIKSQSDLRIQLAKHDAVVLGFYSNLKGAQFARFRFAASKALERDPSQDIKYIVVPHTIPNFDLNMTEGSIRLYMWNETRDYSPSVPLDYDDLVKWVFDKCQQVCQWVSPPGVKSALLASFLEQTPTLILFTPKNPFYGLSNYYYLLKEIAIEYFTCDVIGLPSRISLQNTVRELRNQLDAGIVLNEAKCGAWIKNSGTVYGPAFSNIEVGKKYWSNCCLSYLLSFTNRQYLCSACVYSLLGHKSHCYSLHSYLPQNFFPPHIWGVCKEFSIFKNPFEKIDVCCHMNLQSSYEYQGQLYHEDFHMNEVIKEHENEICRQFHHAKILQNTLNQDKPIHHVSEDIVDRHEVPVISGGACMGNRTLTFIAMDSFLFRKFSSTLGIDLLQQHNHTSVAIVDVMNESTYVLSGKLTKRKLKSFISDFNDSKLPRYMRTKSLLHLHDSEESSISVKEVNTEMLQKLLRDETKDLVVLFYTPWCGFTMTSNHIFLSVASLFHKIETIQFARIDLASNDLPWNLTLTQDPSLIVFPQRRYADSKHFPSAKQFNKSSILKFILTSVSVVTRVEYVLLTCQRVNCDKVFAATNNLVRRLLSEYRMITKRLRKCSILNCRSHLRGSLVLDRIRVVEELAYLRMLQVKLDTRKLQSFDLLQNYKIYLSAKS